MTPIIWSEGPPERVGLAQDVELLARDRLA
jgi:hypothetical protein